MITDSEDHVPTGSIAIIHLECAGIAFRLDHLPKIGEPMTASSVVWPIGAKHGEPIVCAECSALCHPADLLPEGGLWAE